LGKELDAIRQGVLDSLGEDDASYIRGVITLQRRLEVIGRALLVAGWLPPAWIAGTGALSSAKILENMEIGHNVLHGQWDWMRDPEISSTTWEWDNATPAADWKHSHNEMHHMWTNVIGKDRDVGYSVIRLSDAQKWNPGFLLQPLTLVALAAFFEYGIAIYDAEIEKVASGEVDPAKVLSQMTGVATKVGRQFLKDYVLFPLMAGPSAIPMLTGAIGANLVRNLWTHVVIFCGHLPGSVPTFTQQEIEGETRGEWYVRQLEGSANLDGTPLFHLFTGHLSFQIEHHLFPDIPSNRYPEIAPKVKELCKEYGLPYASGRLTSQYSSVIRKVMRFSLPPLPKFSDLLKLPTLPKVPAFFDLPALLESLTATPASSAADIDANQVLQSDDPETTRQAVVAEASPRKSKPKDNRAA
jgi:linoleoyl-CoA desaturase